jgi:hypothetical protein
MTDDSIALRELLEKSADADLLREMIGFAAERLMALEVRGRTGAGYGERAPNRLTQRCRRQRYTVLLAGLDPVGRHGPDRVFQVDLAPRRAAYFARSGGGQDRELEGASADAFALRELGHEGGRLAPVQGGVVLDSAHLGRLRQEVAEVPSPSGWVAALSGTCGGGVVEHGLKEKNRLLPSKLRAEQTAAA